MELRANTTDRVCSECGKEIAAWVITFAWGGMGIALCDEHYDTLGTLSPKAKKPEPKPKKAAGPRQPTRKKPIQTTKPKREIY